MRKSKIFLILLIFYSYFISWGISESQSFSKQIASTGIITYNNYEDLVLMYSTNFEDAAKLDDNHLNLQINHRFNFGSSGDGASMWVERGFAHSGSSCIGMELFDVTKSRRNEFNILNLQDLVGDEYFISVWLYLPSDWSLHTSDWNFFEVVVPFEDYSSNWLPYSFLHIYQPNILTQTFDVTVGIKDINNDYQKIDSYLDFPLPLGRWFKVEYYVFRHLTDGEMRFWIDNILICSKSGLTTKETDAFYASIAKIYYRPDDNYSPYKLWVDDLKIYGKP